MLRLRYLLADDGDVCVFLFSLTYQPEGGFPPQRDGQEHARKQHHVAQWQHGEHVVQFDVHQLFFVSLKIGYHGKTISVASVFAIVQVKSFLHVVTFIGGFLFETL